MKKNIRRIVSVVLAAILVVSLVMILVRRVDYRRGEQVYTEAEEMVVLPDLSVLPPPVVSTPEDTDSGAAPEQTPSDAEQEPVKEVYVDPYADALRAMDFTALQEVNSDVLGWILIPDTRISYPLVQGENNDYYLNRTWKKWRSAVGSIFLEYRNAGDFSDFNTIIYGHRMNNGSMFASLSKYKKQSYWEAHPCIYITDASGTKKYDIFAAYEIGTAEDTYRIVFEDDVQKQSFLDFCMSRSVINTGIIPTVDDSVITLSTCTGRGHATRWVVQGRLHNEVTAEETDDGLIDDAAQGTAGDTVQGAVTDAAQNSADAPPEGTRADAAQDLNGEQQE